MIYVDSHTDSGGSHYGLSLVGGNKEEEGVNLRNVVRGGSRPNRLVDTTTEVWYKSVQLSTLRSEHGYVKSVAKKEEAWRRSYSRETGSLR